MKHVLPLLFIIALLGCAETPKEKATTTATSLQQLNWLLGDWQGTYNNAPFYESWRMVNDSLLLNFSIEVSAVDTMLRENGYIRLDENGITHGGEKYIWELGKFNDDEIVFVNDILPFARRISWKHGPNDHWLTEIENPTGKINYDLQRVTWLAPIVDGYMLAADKIPTTPLPN